jgi:excisionase family DNA binding protein
MEPPSDSHRGGYRPSTLPEAARILGVSESTVRRLVKAGKLEAERVLRPQGHVWLVNVPSPSMDAAGTRQQVSTAEGGHPPTADPLAAWTRTVLEPLVAELSLSRQTIERQAQQLGDLREERGRLTVELEHARAQLAAAEVPREPDPPIEPPPTPAPAAPTPNGQKLTAPWWSRWWGWLGGP